FDSVVEATRCAAALREAVARHNRTLRNEQRLAIRIGVNLGDIIAEGGDIFGDGVNIAARLEALAEPGSIFVSEMAYYHVADKVDFDFEDLGPQTLKNIRRPRRPRRRNLRVASGIGAIRRLSQPRRYWAPAFRKRRTRLIARCSASA